MKKSMMSKCGWDSKELTRWHLGTTEESDSSEETNWIRVQKCEDENKKQRQTRETRKCMGSGEVFGTIHCFGRGKQFVTTVLWWTCHKVDERKWKRWQLVEKTDILDLNASHWKSDFSRPRYYSTTPVFFVLGLQKWDFVDGFYDTVICHLVTAEFATITWVLAFCDKMTLWKTSRHKFKNHHVTNAIEKAETTQQQSTKWKHLHSQLV